MKSGWRSNRPRDTVLGGIPARLLLGGIAVAGIGLVTFLLGFLAGFGAWVNRDSTRVFELVALAGLVAVPCGAVIVALGLVWWVVRIARWVWRNTPD